MTYIIDPYRFGGGLTEHTILQIDDTFTEPLSNVDLEKTTTNDPHDPDTGPADPWYLYENYTDYTGTITDAQFYVTGLNFGYARGVPVFDYNYAFTDVDIAANQTIKWNMGSCTNNWIYLTFNITNPANCWFLESNNNTIFRLRKAVANDFSTVETYSAQDLSNKEITVIASGDEIEVKVDGNTLSYGNYGPNRPNKTNTWAGFGNDDGEYPQYSRFRGYY